MSEFKSSNFRNEDGSGGPDIVGLTTFTSPYYFVPPSGTTAERPSDPAPGMLRFNTDIGRLEVWRGDHWATILGESPSLNGGARGLFIGGQTPANTNTIDYITISTLGNASDFGDLTTGRANSGTVASSTRGISAGGEPQTANIFYVTISSTGNATDFSASLTESRRFPQGVSNSIRGVFAGGTTPLYTNTIDYITIASTGVAAQDFGDLETGKHMEGGSGINSSTRGIWFGGTPGVTNINTIQYITISTLGNSIKFGDLAVVLKTGGGRCSNSTRGVCFGGNLNPGVTNVIDYVTIATLGNSQDFGDLTTPTSSTMAVSSSTRGISAGGRTPAYTNVIEYITILTTGNSIDFGDLTETRAEGGGLSNAHGGL